MILRGYLWKVVRGGNVICKMHFTALCFYPSLILLHFQCLHLFSRVIFITFYVSLEQASLTLAQH